MNRTAPRSEPLASLLPGLWALLLRAIPLNPLRAALLWLTWRHLTQLTAALDRLLARFQAGTLTSPAARPLAPQQQPRSFHVTRPGHAPRAARPPSPRPNRQSRAPRSRSAPPRPSRRSLRPRPHANFGSTLVLRA